MGKVKNAFMDQIESDFEYRSLVDPRFASDPEPTIDKDIKELVFRASCFLEQAQDVLKDTNILDKIDGLDFLKDDCEVLTKLVNKLLSQSKEAWELQ